MKDYKERMSLDEAADKREKQRRYLEWILSGQKCNQG